MAWLSRNQYGSALLLSGRALRAMQMSGQVHGAAPRHATVRPVAARLRPLEPLNSWVGE